MAGPPLKGETANDHQWKGGVQQAHGGEAVHEERPVNQTQNNKGGQIVGVPKGELVNHVTPAHERGDKLPAMDLGEGRQGSPSTGGSLSSGSRRGRALDLDLNAPMDERGEGGADVQWQDQRPQLEVRILS